MTTPIELPPAPVEVAELDLERPDELHRPGRGDVFAPNGRVLALIRRGGQPLCLVTAEAAPGDPAALCRALAAAAASEPDPRAPSAVRPEPPPTPRS